MHQRTPPNNARVFFSRAQLRASSARAHASVSRNSLMSWITSTMRGGSPGSAEHESRTGMRRCPADTSSRSTGPQALPPLTSAMTSLKRAADSAVSTWRRSNPSVTGWCMLPAKLIRWSPGDDPEGSDNGDRQPDRHPGEPTQCRKPRRKTAFSGQPARYRDGHNLMPEKGPNPAASYTGQPTASITQRIIIATWATCFC